MASNGVDTLEAFVLSLRAALEDCRTLVGPDAKAALREAVESADSPERFHEVRASLGELISIADKTANAVRGLLDDVEDLYTEWVASIRFTDVGLAVLERELEAEFAAQPVAATRRWVHEIFDALRAGESDAAVRIGASWFGSDERLKEGAGAIRSELDAWNEQDDAAGLRLLEPLASGRLAGWQDVLDPLTRARAHRLAAWVSLRRLIDADTARKHLDQAIDLVPYDGVSYAESAALSLSQGLLDRAASDARRAIELAPDDSAGYLQLGCWAELSGLFEDAGELYAQAIDRMPSQVIATMSRRSTLLDAPGALLVVAARKLLESGRNDAALETLDAALLSGVRGPTDYPETEAYHLRSEALERLPEGSRTEAAACSVEAAKRHLWSDNPAGAVEELERAIQLHEWAQDAGWLLADGLTAMSFGSSTEEEEQQILERARAEWDAWEQKTGPPSGSASWALLTRAGLAEMISFRSGNERETSLWEAVIYVERALVHDPFDAQRWGYASRFLRILGYGELAWDAAEQAYALNPHDATTLGERLALFANRGRFEDAEQIAIAYVSNFGPNPWVSAVRAWLALNRDQPEEALALLELPRAANDLLGWYHSLRADCHLALGENDAAVDDYRAAVKETNAVDGTQKCQLAIACALLRDIDTAKGWLRAAAEDSTTHPADYGVAEAYAALAEGELELGLDALRNAVSATTVPYRLDLMKRRFPLRVRLLTDDPTSLAAWESAIHGVFEADGDRQRRSLEQQPPNADSELEAALLEQHDDGAAGSDLQLPATALLAIRSRRQSAAGAYSQAADGYERLRGSRFEPEATIELGRSLKQASDESAAEGQVDEVERIQQRLSEAGVGDPIAAGLAVVSALQAAERADEARARLEELLERSDGDDTRELQQRLGELLAADGDFSGAYEQFASALASARYAQDWSNVAQLEGRLAVVQFAAGDVESAKNHVRLGLDAWRDAGAFEPVWILMHDLIAMAAAGLAFWGPSVAKALSETLGSLRRDGELPELTDAELASYTEELTSAAQMQPVPATSSGATSLISGLTSFVSRLGSGGRGRGES